MTRDEEFYNIKYKEGSLEPKTRELIFFAASIAIGHENGAKIHLGKARECGASEEEITESMVYAMQRATAKVRYLGRNLIEK
ncbi:MAG: carboxymuconolactone decarboxylase family protein [Deltaproteobacteria bacterium]|nr:MAG: carboxymuconolactone decarboxylase family protein [Deltaproteobacteria bacterium]